MILIQQVPPHLPKAPALDKRGRLPTAALTLSKHSLAMTVKHTVLQVLFIHGKVLQPFLLGGTCILEAGNTQKWCCLIIGLSGFFCWYLGLPSEC